MPTAASITGTEAGALLLLNAGSSSIKFALLQPPGLESAARGQVERIGSGAARFEVESPEGRGSDEIEAPHHDRAAAVLLDWLAPRAAHLAAAGHRVVRAPRGQRGPARVEPALLEALHALAPLDPEHLPHELALIEAVQRRWPALPQVACFDTSFHDDLPRVARILPIPRRYGDAGIERLGFHGLSYQYLMRALAQRAGAQASHGRVVLAHLGNGASLAAVRAGRPLDTSMGYTPTGGVPMSTRSGDLDPGVPRRIAELDGLDAAALDELLTRQSGLLGVSGTSSDMRDLQQRAGSDVRAAEAVELFCHAVKKCIGAYAAALGGLDTLVFSGGIGEHAPAVRAQICAGLEFLGVAIDPARNAADAPLIGADSARVAVHVIATDEESMIARGTCTVLGLPCDP